MQVINPDLLLHEQDNYMRKVSILQTMYLYALTCDISYQEMALHMKTWKLVYQSGNQEGKVKDELWSKALQLLF